MTVLDASALLAYVYGEAGAEQVEEALSTAPTIHAVNLAEVLSRLAERGSAPEDSMRALTDAGVMKLLQVDPGTVDDALNAARFHPVTRHAGLSLGDRYCLALAARLDVPVLTADRAWADLNVGVTVELIR
ncbi:type II toxin-antitoxin system VapC family toxin [Deinococcus sonorensis]|uniref:Type II toxin-antitoxin system VapC family toxin n=2 Tax=Deinococcus sonorensis TaxID=309891 RepID=A0AAU7U5S5_9DEIO